MTAFQSPQDTESSWLIEISLVLFVKYRIIIPLIEIAKLNYDLLRASFSGIARKLAHTRLLLLEIFKYNNKIAKNKKNENYHKIIVDL